MHHRTAASTFNCQPDTLFPLAIEVILKWIK
jgi:hypothetical protein